MEHVCEMTDKYYVLYQTVLPHQFLYFFVCDIASFRLIIDIEKAYFFLIFCEKDVHRNDSSASAFTLSFRGNGKAILVYVVSKVGACIGISFYLLYEGKDILFQRQAFLSQSLQLSLSKVGYVMKLYFIEQFC